MAKRRKRGSVHLNKTRKIGKRRLTCKFAWPTKTAAKKFASNARKRGRVARVVKGNDSAGFRVYGVCTGKARR